MSIPDFSLLLVSPDDSLQDAMQLLNQNSLGIVLVADQRRNLLGTVTDGDLRRAILAGVQIDDHVEKVMKAKPIVCEVGSNRAQQQEIMKKHDIRQVPLVDNDGQLIDLVTMDTLRHPKRQDIEIIVMAGGLGTRLRPLTENIPKPMLEVGGKPILQRIVENLMDQGFYRFHFCVNYLAHMIHDHFGDGSTMGAEISYVHEERRMGTGGALSILKQRPDQDFIVMNGDILTMLDFRLFMEFHRGHEAIATIALNEYKHAVPFGVIDIQDGFVSAIREKPTYKCLVNAGIYALSPGIYDYIESDSSFDMTDLVAMLFDKKQRVGGYPVLEYWLDVGNKTDLQTAREL